MRVFVSTVLDHNDPVFFEILQRLGAEPSGVLFLNLDDPNRFPLTRAFAKYAFSYEDCRKVSYTQHPLYAECPPLEPNLLEKMAPYANTFFRARLRDLYPDYRIMWSEYCEHLRFWSHALDVMKIDVFASIAIPHLPHEIVIAGLCKLRQTPIVSSFHSNLLGNNFILNSLEDPCPKIRNVQERLQVAYKDADAEAVELTAPYEKCYQEFHLPGFDLTPVYVDRPIKDGIAPAIFNGLLKPFFSGEARLLSKNDLYKKHLYKYSIFRYWRCVHMRLKLLFFLSKSLFCFSMKRYMQTRKKFLG